MKLMVTALESRHLFNGFLAGHGGPALFDLSPGRLCDFVRWYLTKDADEKSVRRFEADLFRPPPGAPVEEAAGPWSPEAETAALGQFGPLPG